MKTILVVLLLVSSSVFAQTFPGIGSIYDSQQPQQDFYEQHSQKLDRQAEQRAGKS